MKQRDEASDRKFTPDGIFWGTVLVLLVGSSVCVLALAVALEIRRG